MGELVATPTRKFRGSIPREHQVSLDTRIKWLWHQRFGTVQTIWNTSRDVLDHTACTLILQAIMAKDLTSVQLLLQRLEGGAIMDEEIVDRAEGSLRV
jgi:hypothetical protein